MPNRFKHYPVRPKKLTAAFARQEYNKLLSALPLAEASKTPQLWLELYARWNALKSYISSEAGRISYEYSKDMSQKKLEATERYFREKITPVIDKPEHTLTQAFLDSKHRKTLTKRYGEMLVDDYKIALKPLDPINTELGIKIGTLGTRYEKILAAATVKLGGEELNLSKLRSYGFSPSSKIRKDAYLAGGDWFLKNHVKLAKIYDNMVTNRTQMGKNLKDSTYIPLGYQIRGRIGYGQAEVARFRKMVQKHFVPALETEMKHRAKLLGQPALKPWDVLYNPISDLPLGIAPVDKQLDNAYKLFGKLSPVLAKHFKTMQVNSWIDLETRPNKQAGAYATEFSDENKVVIFCNSTGDAEDVSVLVHEMGHAFQFWESQGIETVDLQSGTYELAEVYSMGMEFLSLPYINLFLGNENARKFAKAKWSDSLYTLVYVCIVDEFQHWVYEYPKATIAQRDKKWVQLYTKYLPGVDFSGFEKYISTRWYAQRHIFVVPFYYIDYALAETAAMQLGMLADQDHAGTITKYLALCKIGGTKSFLGALSDAGLRLPFEEKLIKDLVAYSKSKLSA